MSWDQDLVLDYRDRKAVIRFDRSSGIFVSDVFDDEVVIEASYEDWLAMLESVHEASHYSYTPRRSKA